MRRIIEFYLSALAELSGCDARSEYEQSLAIVESLLRRREYAFATYLLIRRAQLLQTSDDRDETRALTALKLAHESLADVRLMDPTSVAARVELASYLDRVEDAPEVALPVYEEGIRLGLLQLESAMLGRVECVEQLRGASAALILLEEVERMLPRSARTEKVKSYLLECIVSGGSRRSDVEKSETE